MTPADLGAAEFDIRATAQRFPTIIVGRKGELGLLCLIQRPRPTRVEVIWGRLEVDTKTGVPSIGRIENLTRTLEQEFRLSPPVVAADGRSVFMTDRSGRLVRLPIPQSG